MIRRSFLKHLAALPLFATATSPAIGTSAVKLKIMIKSAWGSDDPTKAAFPFLHGDALAEALAKIAANKIPIYACGACSRARGVTETDLNEYGAKFGNPKIFVSLVEWADKIITE
jgi:DsrE/DsrF-like family